MLDRSSDRYQGIFAENSRIIERLVEDGLDLDKQRKFEFRIPLPNKEACEIVRRTYWDKFEVPESGMFIIINDPEEYQLLLSVYMIPSPEAISGIEVDLLESAPNLPPDTLFWEFRED